MIQDGSKNEFRTLRDALRRRLPVGFLIITQGCTSSTLSTSTLDTHSEVACHEEIPGALRAILRHFVENVARGSRASILKSISQPIN
ncbi:hypothetical protein BA899_09785 [Spiribacter sp. SSL99]|nr:hypothetical protein BA899_09785 [Spiribacter sp. SSL99]